MTRSFLPRRADRAYIVRTARRSQDRTPQMRWTCGAALRSAIEALQGGADAEVGGQAAADRQGRRLALGVRLQHRPAGVHLRVPLHLQRPAPPQVGGRRRARPDLHPLCARQRVLARQAADGRLIPRRRLPEQRHALLDRVARPERGARDPQPPGHGRALLHLRADGDRLRQLRLRRPASDRLEGRELRDRRARLGGRAARGRRPVAGALTHARGS